MICLIFAASTYNIPVSLLSKIWRVESSYSYRATISDTADYGPMQINKITIEHYNLKPTLVQKPCYSFIQSAKILNDLKSRFPRTYKCRYNIGTAKMTEKRLTLCKNYTAKLGENMNNVVDLKYYKMKKEVENFARAKVREKLSEAVTELFNFNLNESPDKNSDKALDYTLTALELMEKK